MFDFCIIYIYALMTFQNKELNKIIKQVIKIKIVIMNHKIYTLFTLFLCLILLAQCRVSYENVKEFFRLTYDQNQDQEVTWKQFCDYFKLVEPDHKFTFDVLNSAFNAFDGNKDGKIKLAQFIDLTDMDFEVKTEHKQIHIGFTQNQNQMQVMWVSNPEEYPQPAVYFGQYQTKLNQVSKATTTHYNLSNFSYHGRTYRAVMSNLKPGQRYYYKVGDMKTLTFSQIKNFKAPPKRNSTLQEIRFAVFGDMGTYMPFGHMVTKMLTNFHTVKPYDFVLLTGDLAYAGIGHKQVQPIWDLFGQQTQSFAAYTAFMPGVGNHQVPNNYTSYLNRYRLPRQVGNQTNLWFSFDFGQVHVVHISSEHSYDQTSQQYKFLEQDLRKARENPNTKWIVLGTHKAFYYSDKQEYVPVTPLAQKLQDLINKYKVDLVQTAHLHSYERTWPVYKGKAMKQNHTPKYYINPQTPIYVVQGTGGALISQQWLDPAPEWSLKRSLKYGYGQVTIRNNYLKYEFVTLPVGKVMDTWYIVKDQNGETIKQDIQ